MKIPRAAAAKRLLAAMYHDSATVVRTRVDKDENRMVAEPVYSNVKCHLSTRRGLGAQRGASLKQTAGHAQVLAGYTVYFAPEVSILAGDEITVTNADRTVRGRAGHAVSSAFSVVVTLDAVTVA